MRKNSFTIVEILTVVVIMGLILGLAKNFLNTTRQEKLLFGETCVNYVFSEMHKFNEDIKFSKNNVSQINGMKVVKTSAMLYGSPTIPHNTTSDYVRSTFIVFLYDKDENMVTRYTNFGPSYRSFGEPAAQCKSSRFTMAVQGSPLRDICRLHTDKGDFLSDDCGSGNPENITGESILNVCDLVSISTLGPGTAKNCIEVGKIITDKRQDDYFFLKCIKTNPATGICQQRPTIE